MAAKNHVIFATVMWEFDCENDEYVEIIQKSSSNSQAEFKGNVKYLLKNSYYVIKLPCWLYWETLMQYNAIFVRFVRWSKSPQKSGVISIIFNFYLMPNKPSC